MRTAEKKAPLVLIVARNDDADASARLQRAVAEQTYPHTQLFSAAAADIASELPTALSKFSPGYVLFWPEAHELKPAAIEKLLLALELAPEQEGVGDVERGSTGLWLTRYTDSTRVLITLWHQSQLRWIEECHKRKAKLFFIPENLIANVNPDSLRRPFAVEHLFGKLPFQFENYQLIPVEPIWSLDDAEIDEGSVMLLVSNLQMGGACKFVLDIAAQLKSRGYRVTVATTGYESENAWLNKLLEITPDVFVLSNSRPVELPRLVVHLARTRRCGRVIISHSMLGYQLLPWLRTELPEVTFLDYTHIEYEQEQPNGGYALRSANHQSLLDLSMVSTNHLKGWMVEHGATAENIRVCHTNIDTEQWKPNPAAAAQTRRELGIDAQTALILYPCRLAEQKRPELMCNIVAALRKATKVPFVVVVAGDGQLMPALKNFIQNQGLEDSFELLGAVPLNRVAQLHNAADILLLPSLIEGIALALFEAMALETVPVISDVGGQRELVTPDCGYLIPTGEIERELVDYVTALKSLLENPSKRRQQASACRKRVQDHFRLDQMTSTFISAMEEASRNHATRTVRLPEPAICREMATLALDQMRLIHEGCRVQEMVYLLQDQAARQEKLVSKLRRQVETPRATDLVLERK